MVQIQMSNIHNVFFMYNLSNFCIQIRISNLHVGILEANGKEYIEYCSLFIPLSNCCPCISALWANLKEIVEYLSVERTH